MNININVNKYRIRMSKDNKSKIMKTDNVKRSKRIEEQNRKKKQIHDSSDEDDDASFHPSDSEEEMDVHEYRKFLSKLFPSKHLDKKIKAGEKIKELVKGSNDIKETKESKENDYSDNNESENDSPIIKKKSSNKSNKNTTNKSNKNKKIVETESSEYEDDEDYDDEYEDININNKNNKKFNIIFTIGNVKHKEDEDYSSEYEEDEDSEWETEDESETENEDESVSSDSDGDDDEQYEKEEEEEEEYEEEEYEEEEDIKLLKKKNAFPKKKTSRQIKSENENENTNKNKNKNKESQMKINTTNTTNPTDIELINILKNLKNSGNNSGTIDEFIKICETKEKKNIQKQERQNQKQKDKNERIFRKILSDKNSMNDFSFFNKMEKEEQIKIIKELREINRITRIEKPYRLTLLESDIPIIFKASAMKKISSLRHMEPGSGEFYKIKNWVDTFMRIPFGKVENLPVNIDNGVDVCHEFMEKSKNILDGAVYGLNDAKMQIMQMLGQLITNPTSIGTAIAIHGPPGTGKTSLVKEGISKILNRPFAFIALGGATDSSFLEGHSYTYEGSMWGKIVQILIDSKCMNPVIYFDELDKISDTPKGEEIAGILTHLTDTSQNSQFHDKYFAEIDFDLSKCLFIFSYNDESKVNPILRDRMYRIQTKGYDKKQKLTISNDYLLPKIREQVRFEEQDIIIPNETIQYMVENYCNNEDGVRNLKRCLEIIYTKLNLYRLMKPGSNLFEQDMSLNVTFPFTVTKDIVDKLIKKTNNDMHTYLMSTMYV